MMIQYHQLFPLMQLHALLSQIISLFFSKMNKAKIKKKGMNNTDYFSRLFVVCKRK